MAASVASRTASLLGAALALGLLVSPAPSAKPDKKTKKVDMIWVHPSFDSLGISSIALLPPATYDNSIPTEKMVESTWGQAFRPTGYRWYSSTLSKDMLKRSFGGDSIVKALREGLLKNPRVDSLVAPKLCAALRTSAVMSVRVDIWEKLEMEWNQAGKPSTSVQLKAALVDASGRLLWSASGSETAEGPYHDPSAGTVGVKQSGLTEAPITGQSGAPSFEEVMALLLGRWVERFPAKAGAATGTR